MKRDSGSYTDKDTHCHPGGNGLRLTFQADKPLVKRLESAYVIFSHLSPGGYFRPSGSGKS